MFVLFLDIREHSDVFLDALCSILSSQLDSVFDSDFDLEKKLDIALTFTLIFNFNKAVAYPFFFDCWLAFSNFCSITHVLNSVIQKT